MSDAIRDHIATVNIREYMLENEARWNDCSDVHRTVAADIEAFRSHLAKLMEMVQKIDAQLTLPAEVQ